MPSTLGIVASHVRYVPPPVALNVEQTAISYTLSGFSFQGTAGSAGYYRTNENETITGITYTLSGASYTGTGVRPPGW